MVLKTPKRNNRGFTLVELILTVSVIGLLIVAGFMYINPVELKQKARDKKRISDISVLERAVVEYNTDNGSYPDTVNILRKSNTLPAGSTGPIENAKSGWITQDLSRYTSILPIDPINDTTYFYSYKHTDFGYELNSILEYYSSYSLNQSDGGSDDNVYEVGNALTIL